MPEFLRRGRPSEGGHEDERLSALLDDELAEDEAIRVARHVAGCDRCLSSCTRYAGRVRRCVPCPPWTRPLTSTVTFSTRRRPSASGDASARE